MPPPPEDPPANPEMPNPSRPPMRASDQERDETIQRLQTAFAEGHLDEDEFDTRVRTALASRTQAELEQLTVDLPSSSARPTPTAIPAAPALSALVNNLGHLILAVMGSSSRRGRWRVPEQCTAVAVMGNCVLDLRAAQLDVPVTTINAVAVMGGVEVIVPPGVRVEMSGLPMMGECRNRVRQDDVPPDAPLVQIRGMAVMGGVVARTKTPKRKRKR